MSQFLKWRRVYCIPQAAVSRVTVLTTKLSRGLRGRSIWKILFSCHAAIQDKIHKLGVKYFSLRSIHIDLSIRSHLPQAKSQQSIQFVPQPDEICDQNRPIFTHFWVFARSNFRESFEGKKEEKSFTYLSAIQTFSRKGRLWVMRKHSHRWRRPSIWNDKVFIVSLWMGMLME